MTSFTYTLPRALETAVHSALDQWQADGRMARLWARDALVWSGADEARWLGWLDVVQRSLAAQDRLDEFAGEVARICEETGKWVMKV
jgi:transaldolase/glucose-6-phosphate isomerase